MGRGLLFGDFRRREGAASLKVIVFELFSFWGLGSLHSLTQSRNEKQTLDFVVFISFLSFRVAAGRRRQISSSGITKTPVSYTHLTLPTN